MRFRDARKAADHAYQEDKANAVFEQIPDFAAAARFMVTQIAAQQP
jgi:hypothetical protein